MFFNFFASIFVQIAIECSFEMFSTEKMRYFLLVVDKFFKDKLYCSLLDDEIVCNCITKMSNATSFFDADEKNSDNIVVFVVAKHVNTKSSLVLLVSNQ